VYVYFAKCTKKSMEDIQEKNIFLGVSTCITRFPLIS
jgi:hypothetical protein